VLPGRPTSDHPTEVLFPEHVTTVRRGSNDGHRLHMFWPGLQGEQPKWRRVGSSIVYERDQIIQPRRSRGFYVGVLALPIAMLVYLGVSGRITSYLDVFGVPPTNRHASTPPADDFGVRRATWRDANTEGPRVEDAPRSDHRIGGAVEQQQ
jgi:hypothetical protein